MRHSEFNGKANYGKHLFKSSTRGSNLLIRPNMSTKSQHDFLSSRVVKYWNKIPNAIKDPMEWKEVANLGHTDEKMSHQRLVNIFKNKLRLFKTNNLNQPGQYWELSSEIFNRIDDSDRDSYVNYMLEHPDVAGRKRVNIR